MKNVLRIGFLSLVITLCSSLAWADSTLTVTPNPTAAPVGTPITLDYTISNDSGDWLVASSINPSSDSPFGNFDFSSFDYPILAPTGPESTGMGTFATFEWLPGTPLNASYDGTFDLQVLLFDGNPLTGGSQIGTSDLYAPYSISVATVPEPGSLVLLACGFAAFFVGKRKFAKVV
jgi:PEP-CTERM motif